MNCTHCQSENIRKQKIIYEEGCTESVSHFEYETVKHQSKTKLATTCTPPKKPWPSTLFHLLAIIGVPTIMVYSMDYLPESISTFFTSLKGTSEFLIILPFIFSAYLFRYILWSRKLWKNYYIEHSSWESSWLCLKCGHQFE